MGKEKQPSAIGRVIDRLGDLGGSLSGISLMALMLLTVYGVFMRYILREPSTWAPEIGAFLVVPCVAFALADAQRHRRHVNVVLLLQRLSPGPRKAAYRLTMLVMALYALFVTYSSYLLASESWGKGVRSIMTRIPMFPVQAIITIGVGILLLQVLRDLVSGNEEGAGDSEGV